MEKTYHFKFSSGSIQFEVQSDDKDFIDTKIKEFVHLSTGKFNDGDGQKFIPASGSMAEKKEVSIEKVHKAEDNTAKPKKIVKKRGPKIAEIVEVEEELEAGKVANAIRESPYSPKVKESILTGRNQLNRILLSFYFILEVYGERGVPSTFIADITKHLGNEIKKTNISTQLKKHQELFSSSDIPGKGKTVKYQLSNAGLMRVQELMRGEI
jgi:hypothetical protein